IACWPGRTAICCDRNSTCACLAWTFSGGGAAPANRKHARQATNRNQRGRMVALFYAAKSLLCRADVHRAAMNPTNELYHDSRRADVVRATSASVAQPAPAAQPKKSAGKAGAPV